MMTTARVYSDSEGDFKEWQPTTRHCWRTECEALVKVREWHSHDGAYVDYQYKCDAEHVSWVDGIDS